ncbi:MAG: 4-hydroxy-3-methylbut-2-enyl diphosphate reductase [Rickettsiales bacterium]|nr:4-hydroxy-3-methylbut-2-enyl diphosphate reductase [Rickettsiales bacterium]OUV78980.1 MAG: 4-hydroxy-3-methylbut-2-enyl diphosphate reductase [Rickettsiales bacterium TMED131]
MNILLASPRGFCAGVKRAIEIVELAIEKYGAPIYVRHEIVHNKRVVQDLSKKGAIFVEELEEIPKGSRVIFSAHGVAKQIKDQAKDYEHLTLDATCPLVSKVHKQTEKYFDKSYKIILIGHKGHPEVIGIQGQIPEDLIIIQNESEAESLQINPKDKVAYVTQTTLSLNDTKNIIEILKRKIPNITGPELDDICYATQNRQEAVSELSRKSDLVLVIGSENSSNTKRLAEIVTKKRVKVHRVANVGEIQKEWLNQVNNIGITAGASSPEVLIEEIINYFKSIYKEVNVETMNGVEEKIKFKPLLNFS